MEITVRPDSFDIAIRLLSDYNFKKNFDGLDSEQLKLLKLLQARENNHMFEAELAEMICGEEGTSFPYRSSYYITTFFQNLGFDFKHNGDTRRFWVADVLKQIDIHGIAKIIKKGLFNKRDFRDYTKKNSLKFEVYYEAAIKEFKEFVDDSINNYEEIDLAFLLNMNVNTDILFNNDPKTNDAELNELIHEAKNRFLNPKDKQIALEKVWDAFERLKTYFGSNKSVSANKLIDIIAINIKKDELEREFKTLTKIGNEYRIRHHETNKIELVDESQIDYLFFRTLSLIDLSVRKIQDL